MSKSITTTTREFDTNGNCIKEIVEVVDDQVSFSTLPSDVPEINPPPTPLTLLSCDSVTVDEDVNCRSYL